MKSGKTYRLVLVTAPDLKTARALARAALTARLTACANLVPKVESHYWWQGKLERGAELLLMFKTTNAKLPALERLILARHPYETPEFIALSLSAGSARYLAWISASTGESQNRLRKSPDKKFRGARAQRK
jgi:periplasmic divalent cation tolerance protein